MLALLAAALLLCAVTLIGTYTLLPPLLESLIARDLQKQARALAERPEVDLVSNPQPKMLLGSFEGGRVAIENPVLGGVRPEEATVDL